MVLKTITSSSGLDFRPGDRIKIHDSRPWRIKIYHWLLWYFCDEPQPCFNFTVTLVGSSTVFTLKESE